MKPGKPAKKTAEKADGGSQALSIGPGGVSEKDSPVITTIKRKPSRRK